MAAMSVIGIDFGNESCYVAVARAGGIETIANDYSLRATPSCVAFHGRNRVLGVAAKNMMVSNMKNTIHSFKHLLGRKFNDPVVQKELKNSPYKIVDQKGNIGIQVNYLDEDKIFTPEQITAMLFTKLKEISETALKTKVNDCVISVPSYFTNAQRKALLGAASIAGLNVLRLFNETTATALAYGIYKQDLPAPEEKPRNVVFVDCGQSSIQVSACAFNKSKLKMLSTASSAQLGGRDIDYILADYFAEDFKKRYKVDAKSNQRAYLRLLSEVEKLKKQMSANSTKLPINIECFMEEKDVHGDMKRADMEELCSKVFQGMQDVMQQCLKDSNLWVEDVYAVEIVGGSSRIPAIKVAIEQVFGKSPSTTLNQDEAVSRGCALQCAMLSPAVRVRDFSVTDIQRYPIKLVWDASMGEDGEMEVFGLNDAVPFVKMLQFFRKDTFSMKAYYKGPIPYPDPLIAQYVVKDVKPTSKGESQKVKVKVKVNMNGIFSVSSAQLSEKREATSQDQQENEEENMEANANDSQENADHANHKNDETPNEEATDKKESKKKGGSKLVTKTIELPIETIEFGYSQKMIDDHMEEESIMIANDRMEKERADARNALEEYVYDLRSKLSAEDELMPFVTEADRVKLSEKLDAMENWLYEEGEDCKRQVYADQLATLKALGEPIKARRLEYELQPGAVEELRSALQLTRKAVEQYRAGDERYAHLSDDEIQRVITAVNNAQRWVDDNAAALSNANRTQDPPVKVAAIREQKQSFGSTVNPILNKPKPKVEPPPTTENSEASNNGPTSGTNTGTGDHSAGAGTAPGAPKTEDKMDVE